MHKKWKLSSLKQQPFVQFKILYIGNLGWALLTGSYILSGFTCGIFSQLLGFLGADCSRMFSLVYLCYMLQYSPVLLTWLLIRVSRAGAKLWTAFWSLHLKLAHYFSAFYWPKQVLRPDLRVWEIDSAFWWDMLQILITLSMVPAKSKGLWPFLQSTMSTK